MTFAFSFKLFCESKPDTVEIEAPHMTEAVKLFLQGQWPDGEAERNCDEIESFSVKRV